MNSGVGSRCVDLFWLNPGRSLTRVLSIPDVPPLPVILESAVLKENWLRVPCKKLRKQRRDVLGGDFSEFALLSSRHVPLHRAF